MKRVRFPVRVKRGSSVVTIYRTPTRGYALFPVDHYDAESRRSRRVFANYDQARHAADETVLNLGGGKSDMLTFTGQELLVYRRATEALTDAGVSLDVAAIQFVQSMRTPNGAGGNGVSAGAPGVQPVITPKAAAEVVPELLASKKAKGRSAHVSETIRHPSFQCCHDMGKTHAVPQRDFLAPEKPPRSLRYDGVNAGGILQTKLSSPSCAGCALNLGPPSGSGVEC